MSDQCTEQSFLTDISRHEMTIFRDDGVNRHVKFSRKGSSTYRFDLITRAGYLCYTGDMGMYVFRRLDDMFEFFRTDRNDFNYNQTGGLSINKGYWGEKLEAVDKCDGYKEFSLDKFRANVREYLKGEKVSKEAWEEIKFELLDVHFENGYEAYDAVYRFDFEGVSFPDFFEYSSEEYSYRFVWCCYALVWGIQQYDNAKLIAEVTA